MKTVRVRIAVVVNKKGEWLAEGWMDPNKENTAREMMMWALDQADQDFTHADYFWVEADLPLPVREVQEIQGEVSDG